MSKTHLTESRRSTTIVPTWWLKKEKMEQMAFSMQEECEKLIVNEMLQFAKDKEYYDVISFRYHSQSGVNYICGIIEQVFPKFAKKHVKYAKSGSTDRQKFAFKNALSRRGVDENKFLEINHIGLVKLPHHNYTGIQIFTTSKPNDSGADYYLDYFDISESCIDDIHKNSTLVKFHFVGKNAKRYAAVARKKIEAFRREWIDNSKRGVTHTLIIPNDDLHSKNTGFVDDLSDIIFPEKDKLVALLESFEKAQDVLIDNRLRLNRGVLLYGVSGTGKTSFIRSYAKEKNYRVVEIVSSLPKRKTKRNEDESDEYAYSDHMVRFAESINSIRQDDGFIIVLIDEIDRVCDSVGVAYLLRFIDSLPEKVICAATTNHIEKLDSAITRSGRFDYKFELKNYQDMDYAASLCAQYDITDSDIVEQLAKQSEEGPDTGINPATLKLVIGDYLIEQTVQNQ